MLRDDWKDYQKAVSRLVARAWLDEAFKERFISEPAAVLAENGLAVPSGVEVRVNQNTLVGSITTQSGNAESDAIYEIPLPPKPAGLEDELLRSWSEGNDIDMMMPPGSI